MPTIRPTPSYEKPAGEPDGFALPEPTRLVWNSGAERNAKIRQLRGVGMPLADIGRRVGLTKERVRVILENQNTCK